MDDTMTRRAASLVKVWKQDSNPRLEICDKMRDSACEQVCRVEPSYLQDMRLGRAAASLLLPRFQQCRALSHLLYNCTESSLCAVIENRSSIHTEDLHGSLHRSEPPPEGGVSLHDVANRMTACEVIGRVRVHRITFEHQSSRVCSGKQISWKRSQLSENVEYVETPRLRASHPETSPDTDTLSPLPHTSATLLPSVIPTCGGDEQATAHRKEGTQAATVWDTLQTVSQSATVQGVPRGDRFFARFP